MTNQASYSRPTACLALAAAIAGGGPHAARADDGAWTMVVLPDTQIYSRDRPQIFEAQTDFIVETAAELSTAFVLHVGDMVNNGPSDREWMNAQNAMFKLFDAGIPFNSCVGNHDNAETDFESFDPVYKSVSPDVNGFDPTARDYLRYFGPQFFEDEPWFGGASPSGTSNYQRFVAPDGRRYMVVSISIDHIIDEQRWVDTVLAANACTPAVAVSHRYVYDYRVLAGRFSDPIHGLIDGKYYQPEVHGVESLTADVYFENVITARPNVFMVLCGHVDGEYRRTSTNNAGLPVHEILNNFDTTGPTNGEGWLRLMEFDADPGTIGVQTYSTWLDEAGRRPGQPGYTEAGKFRTLDDRRRDHEAIIRGFAGEFLSLIPEVDPAVRALLLQIAAQPDYATTIFEAVRQGDPSELIPLLTLLGIEDSDAILELLETFPFDDVNANGIEVLDRAGPSLLAPILDGDVNGIVSVLKANDFELFDLLLFADGSRDSHFVLPFDYGVYASAASPAGALNGFLTSVAAGDRGVELTPPHDRPGFFDVAAFLADQHESCGCASAPPSP